jgi:hypothetical protein
VCIGTGPSLSLTQIEIARQKGFVLFGCNRVFEIVPDLAVLYGVNTAFWEYYWDRLEDHGAEKWTTNPEAAKWFGLNLIGEINAPGLSTDPTYVHHGHGSGATQVNLASLMGAERIVLLGYDLCYAPDYDGRQQRIGSTPRHYFGEYPTVMQHWPSVKVKDGVHYELLDHYRSIADQGLVEIINCTDGGVLDAFPCARIEDL